MRMLDTSRFRGALAERFRDEGRDEGRVEGRVEGIAGSILRILENRNVVVRRAARERITSCTDPELLGVWLDRSLTVSTTAQLFTPPS